MDTINEAGGKFQSVSEPWADTTTHAGKMIMTIFAGIAEFERDLIRERTSAGREAAASYLCWNLTVSGKTGKIPNLEIKPRKPSITPSIPRIDEALSRL